VNVVPGMVRIAGIMISAQGAETSQHPWVDVCNSYFPVYHEVTNFLETCNYHGLHGVDASVDRLAAASFIAET